MEKLGITTGENLGLSRNMTPGVSVETTQLLGKGFLGKKTWKGG